MNSQKEFWNMLYGSVQDRKLQYDLWLDKYADLLSKSKDLPIIDLGCGLGNNTLYLTERSYKVIPCDFSEEALKGLNKIIDNLDTKCFDFRDGLPFASGSTKVIIADLSLHYFTWSETLKILKEIQRVLMSGGVLLCRVNSTKDMNYGAGHGTQLEKNYYNIEGKLKRFFDEEQLRELFEEWEIQYIKETEINRYKMRKVLWELSLKKA